MSYLVAAPEMLTSAADVGSSLTAAHAAAAVPTSAVAAAAGDEVSTAPTTPAFTATAVRTLGPAMSIVYYSPTNDWSLAGPVLMGGGIGTYRQSTSKARTTAAGRSTMAY
jgi:hypothetical protein